MRRYDVCYSMHDIEFQRCYVWADNVREVRKIMKRDFGSDVVIHEIEEE